MLFDSLRPSNEKTVYTTPDGFELAMLPDSLMEDEAEYSIYSPEGYYIDTFTDDALDWSDDGADMSDKKKAVLDKFFDIVTDYSDEPSRFGWEDSYVTDARLLAKSYYNDDYDDQYEYDYKARNWKPREKSPEEIEQERRQMEELLESLCKSDTIVFHMDDPSTVMLKPIYEGQGWDVYTGSGWGMPKEFFHELIKRHDKVMCLGHGTPMGLIGGVIGRAEVPLLKEKKIFALWCYAATFFKDNGFEGHGVFCSDNCPSEVWECRVACDATVSAEWILNNMYYLSDCIKGVLDLIWDNPEEACRRAKEAYSKAEATTEDEKKVVEFNTNTLQVV